MTLEKKELYPAIEAIKKRLLPCDGFSVIQGGSFRPDITAWAVLALRAQGGEAEIVRKAQRRLADYQMPDGRIAISKEHQQVFWPTPLAILAWHKNAEFEKPRQKAIDFMLAPAAEPDIVLDKLYGHDTSLKGWPWTSLTYSWALPTSLAVLALKASGYEKHERLSEAARMLHDRQLPSGGWNYGNTIVFGTELMPIPECTGHALNAITTYAEYEQVAASINYLENEAPKLHSPLSLAWAILGLGAWHQRPKNSNQQLLECVTNQKRLGNYSTDLLSQIVVAYHARQGLLSIFEDME